MSMPRQKRSVRTRERLLDATVDCLIEVGYARTSMQEVCTRAGLSRGAQLHHFPTKAELMAAAIEHLTRKQAERVMAAVPDLPEGPRRMGALIDLLWSAFSGRLAKASIELWVASSNDPQLRAVLLPVERGLGFMTVDLCRRYAGPDADPALVETLSWLTIDLNRGLAVDAMLGGDPKRRDRLLDAWKSMAQAALG